MTQDCAKLIEQMRLAALDVRSAEAEAKALSKKHVEERQASDDAMNRAHQRYNVLKQTLRRVIEEGETIEQAKMIAHEEHVEKERIDTNRVTHGPIPAWLLKMSADGGSK